MSYQTLKRALLPAVLFTLAVSSALAGPPSSRTGSRAVFDESTETAVLFGGVTAADTATAKAYTLDETWRWDGTRWIRRFPAHLPPARYSHSMVYDAKLAQTVVFGGRNLETEFADTWIFKNDDWSEIAAPGPSRRSHAATAFDRSSERVVLFGGQRLSDDAATVVYSYDTWEFDGTSWTRILESGPQIITPLLVFDEARQQLLLLGHDDKLDTKMYAWNATTHAWDALTPAALPPCVNESGAIYNRTDQKVFVIGGVCVPEDTSKSSPSTEEIWGWDGTNWAKVDTFTLITRGLNTALFYDSARDVSIMFGGTVAYTSSPRATTYAFSYGDWSFPPDLSSPGPRSLMATAVDPATNVIYLLGGLTDGDIFSDFWKLENGLWQRIEVEKIPSCVSPNAAFDADRSRLVVLCSDSTTYEWDGTAWTDFADLKTRPTARRFSSMVYDRSLRKTVMFGGFDSNSVYQPKTWLWNGTTWTEEKKKRAPARGLASMWYDPVVRKTVMFGGIGRRNPDGRIERYNDMWAFDGNGWAELKPAAKPTTRYGAQVAVDPTTNKTILFGGLRVDTDEKGLQKQSYGNDTWEWDGTTWRQIQTATAPSPRQNVGMEFNPASGEIVLFGGWSGYFHSDTWVFRDGKWRVLSE
ncbi:MAG: hypothetical protein JJE51_11005 [Thermoanaerobaculia bacterium]|nr:hypothetical protein [Thermoanaerobaculia bacterium]